MNKIIGKQLITMQSKRMRMIINILEKEILINTLAILLLLRSRINRIINRKNKKTNNKKNKNKKNKKNKINKSPNSNKINSKTKFN